MRDDHLDGFLFIYCTPRCIEMHCTISRLSDQPSRLDPFNQNTALRAGEDVDGRSKGKLVRSIQS